MSGPDSRTPDIAPGRLNEGAVDYLSHKLIEEAIVVALVCLIFLLHARSAFVAIITLPLGVLAAFFVIAQQGITANIMSLGGIAIAIGAMVDASIVIEARERLAIAIPAAVLIIFVLLMLHFGRFDRTAMIMLSLPFGLIGGLWAVYLAGYNMSVAVAVGFIALGGIAVETAVVMLLYMDRQVREHPPSSRAELFAAIMAGAVMRVRPKLMTVGVIIAGLLPIFFTEGIGSDVMRRIALPMVGGMASTTILTLIVIPVIYYLWEGRRFKRARGPSRKPPEADTPPGRLNEPSSETGPSVSDGSAHITGNTRYEIASCHHHPAALRERLKPELCAFEVGRNIARRR